MMPPQRQDTFHVATQQPYVPQPPPNQTGTQGPGIRGMAPTGPPTQSSTPPNSDLKVPQMSQQSMNITYVSQAPVRGGGQNFFSRGPPPQSQNPRMPNHRQSQQQMYQTQSAQYVAVQPIQPMYCTMPFYGSNAQRPTASLIPPFFPSQTIFPYPQSPQTPQTYMYIPRPGPPPQVASAPQSLTQAPPPTIPLTQSTQPHTIPRNKQRRVKAIPMIDPNTGKDKLNEMYEQDDSHPASGESSARQTPQPPYIPNKDVQNAFTKQVIIVMSQDKKEELDDHSFLSVLDSHVDNQNIYQTPPQAVLNMSRIDLVQSNKLQVPTKEFVPAMQPSTAKEITPVVSANTDAAEVTITKCNKDRESPAKSRKQREQTARENREVLAKDAPIIPEKSNKDDYKVNKDEYKYSKESVSPTPNAAPTKEVKELNNQREEKKNQKKDKTEQPKVPTGISNPEPAVENVTNPLPPPVAQDNGKLNLMPRGVQMMPRGVQKQAQQQYVSAGQKTTPLVVPIPQTQPSKPNNLEALLLKYKLKLKLKPYIAPVEPQDETDRVELSNDKLIQADTTKIEIEPNLDVKPSLPYKDDQWSPFNQDGKKIYDRDFLLALRNDPKSRKKPDNLLEVVAQEDREKIGEISRYPMGVRTTDFVPNFGGSNYSSKSSSQRGVPPKCNSQQEGRRIRKKLVSNISFIGELFKQQILTVNVMLSYLNNLLENKDEESLECLCMLLTTVGKEIDGIKVDIDGIFNIMKEIVDKKHGKISSRVRFMLQDVIDLRSAKWIPRRQDLSPKTMDQIQKESDTEHLNIQPQIDEPLGSSQLFGNWGRGSNIKTPAPPHPPNTGNMYAALENIGNETDKRIGLGSRSASKDPYNSKGPSLERNYKHTYEDGRGSRSGFQHRSNDNSQRSTPTPAPQQPLPKTNPLSTAKSRVALDQITPERLELRLKNILEEYLNECCSVTECNEDIKTSIPPSALSQLVSDSYINVLERSKTARLRTASLFAQLIKLKTLSIDVYCIGLEEVLSQADDLKIDIPKIWDYLADVIAPVLCENVLPLNRLWKCCSILTSQGHSPKLLAPTFKSVVEEKGPNFLSSIWHDSNLGLSDFMPVSQVNTFIKENQFEFLLGGSNAPSGQSELTYEQIHNKLSQFFLNKNSFDDIINWINANVGDRIKENQFIRTLATAVFEDSIVNSKLKTETLRDHHKLLIRFVDSNPVYELQCLYALQALINKLEHPQGILFLEICNSLYEENVFSYDSFVAWGTGKDPAEQEGKGQDTFHVAMQQPYVPQPPPNQTGEQGPGIRWGIRGLAPTGPPTQASAPRNSDLKVPDITTLPKSKVDITDIVKDVPKPLKPYIAPVEPQDETDQVELSSDKLIQADTTKIEIEPNLDVKPSLPYKDDQWSPFNQDGKKIYDRDFLLALRNDPKSRKKPDNLLEVLAQEDRGKVPPKRNSQQDKVGGGSKGKFNHLIEAVSMGVKENVKLHETENAWKPARFLAGNNLSDENKKTQELYRKVRGVLNKLTPQKFETLLIQVRSLAINNTERLQGVIDLVFEKAVNEPNFSVAYALMCRELALMQVPVSNDGKKKDEFVNFRKLLVTRCQLEFEKNSVDETARNEKLKEIEECTDPEKKEKMQFLMEEEDRRIRRKSVGNIRFIGELFKQQILTVNVMLSYLNNLLENKDEESLECLCMLLTTVGKEIDGIKVDIDGIFNIMKEIVDKKHGKISSRVRFMLQDVIDLRSAKWIPRRQDLNPKTMDQIQKESDTEHLNIQVPPKCNSQEEGRNRSVGNISFIGELFKQQILTVNVMLSYLNNLLENKDEESLESLCMLLTTVGKEIDGIKVDIDGIFNIMKEIVDKKHGKISSRVRYVLQDVIDLRSAKWIPKRQDLNPKTVDLIQKESDTEHLNIQAMNSVPITPCKDDRGNAGPNADRKRNKNNPSDNDGWTSAPIRRCAAFTVQSDKLKNKPPQIDEPLGSSQLFGNWGRSSNIKTPAPPAKWIPKRQDLNPKTVDQIQKESDTEHLNIQVPPKCNSQEEGRRIRRKSVGNISFIGELFKQQILMTKDEESLESLCMLLTTVGKEIDAIKIDIDGIFNIMNEIVDKKHGKISSRVRYVLQDVTELAKWIPRRQVLNPKTMDQIQKESDTEHLNIQPQIDEPLGSSQLFGNWGRGSNIKTPAPPPPPNTGNMYAALENIGNETDKRIGLGCRSASKDAYNSKGPSLERNYKHTYEDGRGSRSGSQHRSNDNSQRSTPTPAPQQPLPKTNPPPTTKSRVTLDQITPEPLELRLKNILEEYLNECCSVTECNEDIKTSIPPSALSQLVSDSYINVLERSKTARLRTASLFAQLIKLETLSIDVYCSGLEEVVSRIDYLKIDQPKIWDYLADVIAPVLCENVLPLNRLWKCCSILTSQGHSPKLLAPTFKSVVEEKGPNFLSSIWHDSNLGLSDFMPVSQVNTFIKENQFEFLLGGSNASSGQSELTFEQIHNKLSQFFLNKNSFDDIINWINANVGDRIKENQFIRTLATAVFEDSIVNSKLMTETLRDHHKLLIRFVDSNPIYELQCLYALQALINKLEHSQEILFLEICNSLHEENVFSYDSFVAWGTGKDPAEQEGKGNVNIWCYGPKKLY